ncbi:hypothetical protein GCM10010166_15880 [Couchioplanes caeruleus subsp. azureus]|nr:hypothetical protein GCM10010166_15880 [Couchioplanes caeruleus subsp. azureus]
MVVGVQLQMGLGPEAVCIHVPTLLASRASHRLRKAAIRNGAHADGAAGTAAGAGTVTGDV